MWIYPDPWVTWKILGSTWICVKIQILLGERQQMQSPVVFIRIYQWKKCDLGGPTPFSDTCFWWITNWILGVDHWPNENYGLRGITTNCLANSDVSLRESTIKLTIIKEDLGITTGGIPHFPRTSWIPPVEPLEDKNGPAPCSATGGFGGGTSGEGR